MERLYSNALTGQNVSSPLRIGTYTAIVDREVLAQAYLSGCAGNGAYRACMTKTLAAGGTYQGPTSVVSLSPGTATVYLPSIRMPLQAGDTLTVWVQGLAADTAVGTVCEVFDVTTSVALSVTEAAAAAAIAGNLTIHTYYTWTQAVTSTSADNLAAAELLFAVKRSPADADDFSRVLISASGGLTTLLGATCATPTAGSLVVSGSTGAWVLTLSLSAAITGQLEVLSGARFVGEIKSQLSGADTLIWSGDVTITRGIVRDTA
jgi:hypothetical protein